MKREAQLKTGKEAGRLTPESATAKLRIRFWVASVMTRALKFWTDCFVLWVVVFSAAAYAMPGVFRPLQPYIVPGLGDAGDRLFGTK